MPANSGIRDSSQCKIKRAHRTGICGGNVFVGSSGLRSVVGLGRAEVLRCFRTAQFTFPGCPLYGGLSTSATAASYHRWEGKLVVRYFSKAFSAFRNHIDVSFPSRRARCCLPSHVIFPDLFIHLYTLIMIRREIRHS